MTFTDKLHASGYKVEQSISGELIAVQNRDVVACVNKNPIYLEMLEEGYLKKNPIVFEVLKGSPASTRTTLINGLAVPFDLRGYVPVLLAQLVYNGVARKMMTIHDASDRWIITTVIDNVKNPLLG